MPFAAVNGQRLFYEDTGGSAPVLVFSHGLLMDHRMFAPQVAAFRHGWRCISWDERGHGATATPGQCAPFSYYDSANDLVALLDHLGVERRAGGHVPGGYLSLRAALTHPQRVRALVLIDTQALKEDPAKMPAHQAVVARWSQQGWMPTWPPAWSAPSWATAGRARPHGSASGRGWMWPICSNALPRWMRATISLAAWARSACRRW
jgi:pimeloyl-ACP methyl ester carboxylesterase